MLGGGDVYRVIDKRVHRTEENSDNDIRDGDDDVSGDGGGDGNDGNDHTYLMKSHSCKGIGPQLRLATIPTTAIREFAFRPNLLQVKLGRENFCPMMSFIYFLFLLFMTCLSPYPEELNLSFNT